VKEKGPSMTPGPSIAILVAANGVRTLAAGWLGRGASITSVVPCQLSRDVRFLLGPKHPEMPD
jgi:hypothetical protein